MRILLIDPPTNCFTGLIKRGYPIGLCMLAAVARQEKIGPVKVYDVDKSIAASYGLNFTDQRRYMADFLEAVNNKEHPVWGEIGRTLDAFQPDVVGITTMTIQFASALRVAEIVKSWDSKCTVLMGGIHASVMPQGMIDWPFTDAVVRGEGEEAFREIIRRLNAGNADLRDIPGVVTKETREKLSEPPLEVADIDSLPFPDREALLDVEGYAPEDLGLMLTSRGCPFQCSFCSNFTRRVRLRSVEKMVEEIVQVQKTYGTIQFMFKDDSFTLNRQRVKAFCRNLLENKINLLWECATRLDLMDDALIQLMKKAGCNRIGVGVESGDEEILKTLNKKLTKEQIRQGTNILNKNNIFWTGYFMMGLPMEREEQIYHTLKFMRELRPPYAALGIYKPYPCTRLFELAAELGLVKENVPNEYFFTTNPVDYFLKDPHRRNAYIPEARLNGLIALLEKEFDRSNKKPVNIIKRAMARQKLYLHDPKSLVVDLKRAAKWLIN